MVIDRVDANGCALVLFRDGADIRLCSSQHNDWVADVDCVGQLVRTGSGERKTWYLTGRRGPRWAPTETDHIQLSVETFGMIRDQAVGEAWFVPLPDPQSWSELSIRFCSGSETLLVLPPRSGVDAQLTDGFGPFPNGSSGWTGYAPLDASPR
jgi:hypothetical protein